MRIKVEKKNTAILHHDLRVQSSIQVKVSYHSAFCKTERSFMSYVNLCSLNAVSIYKYRLLWKTDRNLTRTIKKLDIRI